VGIAIADYYSTKKGNEIWDERERLMGVLIRNEGDRVIGR